MAVARGSQNAGHYYSNIVMPYALDVSFTVTPTNGLGVTSVKSNGWVNNVFMHTSTTPTANGGVTNPNPANGIALIQLKQNFNVFLGASLSYIQSPVTGSALTSVTQYTSYQIVSVGTTTTAQWVAKGLPAGFTPTAGQAFVATATGALGGTGTVKALTNSGIQCMEVIGDPNQLINNSNIASYAGAWVQLQFLGATNSSTTTLIPTAPVTTSVIGVRLMFDRSSVTVDGL